MHDLLIGALVVFVVGMFTNFYGLGSVWENRGEWYTILSEEELTTVLDNLYQLKAFHDGDGLVTNEIKVKVCVIDYTGERLYKVKIPIRVFKLAKIQMTAQSKAALLGLTVR